MSKNEGTYCTLMTQLDRISRHNRQGSFRTKDRYFQAMKRFCRFLADGFNLQKLVNIDARHLNAYTKKLQAEKKSASTIKTDLSAIRFWCDKIGLKRPLPDNDHLAVKLERRSFGGVDRTWSRGEFDRFLQAARQAGHEDYAAIATLTYYDGLRIHEAFRLDTATAEAALRTGWLVVKGKGGKVRQVPISKDSRTVLRSALKKTRRGHKLFVADDVETHLAINQMQQFICAIRPNVQDHGSNRPMTHHGLRHTYAARTYQDQIKTGASALGAHYQVSRLLGHERADVTDMYLTSVKDKARND